MYMTLLSYKIYNPQGSPIQHRECCSIFCNNLNRKVVWERMLLLFSRSVLSNSATPWIVACQAPLSSSISSNSRPLNTYCYLTISSSATPSPFASSLSQHQGLHIRWPNYWSFNFSISPFKEWKVKFAQSCLTLCYPMDCNPPDSSVPGIFQARILE